MKLNKLQKKFLKNSHDAKEVKSQADVAKELSSVTHEKAQKVFIQKKNLRFSLVTIVVCILFLRIIVRKLIMEIIKTKKLQKLFVKEITG